MNNDKTTLAKGSVSLTETSDKTPHIVKAKSPTYELQFQLLNDSQQPLRKVFYVTEFDENTIIGQTDDEGYTELLKAHSPHAVKFSILAELIQDGE